MINHKKHLDISVDNSTWIAYYRFHAVIVFASKALAEWYLYYTYSSEASSESARSCCNNSLRYVLIHTLLSLLMDYVFAHNIRHKCQLFIPKYHLFLCLRLVKLTFSGTWYTRWVNRDMANVQFNITVHTSHDSQLTMLCYRNAICCIIAMWHFVPVGWNVMC
jgi:hypothetical protein